MRLEFLERWQSGRLRATRNRVGGNASGVQIPLSPFVCRILKMEVVETFQGSILVGT